MVVLLVWASGAYDAVPAAGTTFAVPVGDVAPERDVPITRFGAVPFEVLWPDDGTASMPDWQFSGNSTTRHVPGSNRNITQTLGKGPQTLTIRLELASVADLITLKTRVLETDTLVLFAAMTSAPDDRRDVHGESYVYISDVLFMGMGQPLIFNDGVVEVDCTFQRPSP